MTNEEHIEQLKKLRSFHNGSYGRSINKAIDALEQEPCTDAVSRTELLRAIDTWDKFGCDADTKLVPYKDHYIPYIHYDDVVKCIKGMPPVTPIQPCTDAVSRQAVKEQMIKYGFYAPDMTVTEFVEELPPVTPTRPKGHWVYKEGIYGVSFCDRCNFELTINDTNFCPNCGARMESEEA